MIYLGFLLYTALTSTLNAFFTPKLSAYTNAAGVSIIIPARNEEKTIRKCVTKALNSHRDCEVIVVDDDSSDATLIEASVNSNVRCIIGKPKPAEWKGKNWACWQGYQHAKKDYLLFLDADTFLEPESVGHMIQTLEHNNLGGLSISPRIKYASISERIATSTMQWFLLSVWPLYASNINWLNRIGSGPCFLLTRAAYEEIGGHKVVNDAAIEDMALASKLVDNKIPYRLIISDKVVSSLYQSYTRSVTGMSRSLRRAPPIFRICLVVIPLVFLLGLGSIQGFIFVLANRLMVAYKLGEGPKGILFHPLQMITFLHIIYLSFTDVSKFWKGRNLEGNT